MVGGRVRTRIRIRIKIRIGVGFRVGFRVRVKGEGERFRLRGGSRKEEGRSILDIFDQERSILRRDLD